MADHDITKWRAERAEAQAALAIETAQRCKDLTEEGRHDEALWEASAGLMKAAILASQMPPGACPQDAPVVVRVLEFDTQTRRMSAEALRSVFGGQGVIDG